MVAFCRRLVDSAAFHRAIMALILVNAVVMGLETSPELVAQLSGAFRVANVAVQSIFILELAARIVAHGRRPLEFFRSGWNVFDFLVVALSLLPAAGPLATLARLARVLRVGRVVSGMPELRLIIGTMLRSIPSMGHVVVLLALLMYVYGVVGNQLFAQVDPQHWGGLGRAVQTLFVIITLEGWVDIMQKSTEATPWAWVYYVSFIVVAVFVVINLFIAVVINNLEKVRQEELDTEQTQAVTVGADELQRLTARMEEVTAAMRALSERR